MKMALQRKVRWNSQKGSSLIELMIAMLVLAIGLGAVTTLLLTAIASNNRSNRDTTANLLAQKVIEEISAQNVYSDTDVTVSDCAGNQWTFATTPGLAANGGAGATLNPNGTINFAQAYGTIPQGYAMQYVACSNQGGVQTTYEVRWNVMYVSSNTSSRLITAAARPVASNVNGLGGLYFALPVNLRGIGGPNIGE
jgi:type IV pilus modification protein PilV